MNLLAPPLRGEVIIEIGEDWNCRVTWPKVADADRIKLAQTIFTAAQRVADQLGVKVEAKP